MTHRVVVLRYDSILVMKTQRHAEPRAMPESAPNYWLLYIHIKI